MHPAGHGQLGGVAMNATTVMRWPLRTWHEAAALLVNQATPVLDEILSIEEGNNTNDYYMLVELMREQLTGDAGLLAAKSHEGAAWLLNRIHALAHGALSVREDDATPYVIGKAALSRVQVAVYRAMYLMTAKVEADDDLQAFQVALQDLGATFTEEGEDGEKREQEPHVPSVRIEDLPASIKATRLVWADEYVGSAEALIAAGLVRECELPGQPGNGSTMVTFSADGQRLGQGHVRDARKEGRRQIRKMSRLNFVVTVHVDDEEQRRRRAAQREEAQREEREREEISRLWPFPVVAGKPC